MECIAVIQATRPGLDCVIVWDDGTQLVAFAYETGRVKMTRPLSARNLDEALNEVRDNFQILEGKVTRIQDWHDTVARTEVIANVPARWGL